MKKKKRASLMPKGFITLFVILALALSLGTMTLADATDRTTEENGTATGFSVVEPPLTPSTDPEESGQPTDNTTPEANLPEEEAPLVEHSTQPETTTPEGLSGVQENQTEQVPVTTPAGISGLMSRAAVVYVSNYDELKAALSIDNGFTTVVFTTDITLVGSGIRIHESKISVVIDGNGFKLTEFAGIGSTNNIYVNQTSTTQVTLTNMIIDGRNYYGPVTVVNGSPKLIYDKVNYTGPQLIYNRNGSAHLRDSTLTLIGSTGPVGEAGEVNAVIFEGTVKITRSTDPYAIFWMAGVSPTVLVRTGANVTIISPSSSYGVFYKDGGGENMTLTIEDYASLRLETHRLQNTNQQLKSLIVGQNANFTYIYTASNADPAVRIGQNLSVGQNATFKILRNQATAGALIDIAQTNANISFNNPAEVILYNRTGLIFRNTSPVANIHINTYTLNSWVTPPTLSGELLTGALPDNLWARGDSNQFNLNGTVSGGNFTTLSSPDLEIGVDPIDNVPSPSTLPLLTLKTIAFGQRQVVVNPIDENSTTVTGHTNAGAAVVSSYGGHTVGDTADASGNFALPVTPGSLILFDLYRVRAKSGSLWTPAHNIILEAEIIPQGSLAFVTVPETLSFGTPVYQTDNRFFTRAIAQWTIAISDTRSDQNGWKLYAKTGGPLTSTQGYQLHDALVFVDESARETVMNTDNVLIHSNSREQTQLIGPEQEVNWSTDKGLLLRPAPGTVRTGVNYTTTITWTLSDAP